MNPHNVTMGREVPRRPWITATVTLTVLVVVYYAHQILSSLSAYRNLHSSHPFYFAESLDKLGGLILCFLAVWAMRRAGFRDICREVGLSDTTIAAAAFGFGVSLPMLIGFAITRRVTPHIDPLSLFFLTVFSPIVEEVEFRGFGVRQLQRGTGWPFWVVVWPSSILFGYAHVEHGQNPTEMAVLFFMIGAGAVVGAWLVYRWQTLWVAVVFHICMNLWWELFSVPKNPTGEWLPLVLQPLTLILAIVGTLLFANSKSTLSIASQAASLR
jgi:membrane protease YdiL (CAAX protease family)